MTVTLTIDLVTTFLLIVGAFFTLVGSVGMLKLDEPMPRLHAPTKASTLGVGSLLMASMVDGFGRGDGSLHEMLIMAFLFVTAPISANFIAKVNIHRRRTEDPPPALPDGRLWATLDAPAQRDVHDVTPDRPDP